MSGEQVTPIQIRSKAVRYILQNGRATLVELMEEVGGGSTTEVRRAMRGVPQQALGCEGPHPTYVVKDREKLFDYWQSLRGASA